MKVILTAALATSLLGGTAAMAQPGDKNRDRGHQGEQADKKDQKTNAVPSDRGRGRDRAAGGASVSGQAAPTAVAGPQAARDHTAPRVQTAQPAPANAAPMAPAAPSQPVRDTSAYERGQASRTPARQPAPVQQYRGQPYQAPQLQNRSPLGTAGVDTRSQGTRWSRGERIPAQYQQSQYYVNDWQMRGLRQPPGGYRWIRNDNNDFYLALIATGVISDVLYRSDMDSRWQRGYSRTYSYNDDVYYQQCRRSPDPAGVILGGLIGGLLGNAAGHGGSGATIAGVIFGGAVGAALTSNMDCEDRSYAYKTYYNGFNTGRVGSYQWRNPRNDHRGEFRIGGYYNDPYGFRCARFTQVTYIQGHAYNAKGVACRQPDGSWAAVN